jgi:hypothetical protein
MTDEIIDQVINEAAEAPVEAAIEAPIDDTTQATESNEEVVDTANEEEVKTVEAESPAEEVFSKKAVRALSRRDKKLGKLQAEKAALNAELEKFRQQADKTISGDAPKEESFDNYGEYMEAVVRHKIKQEQTQNEQQEQQKQFEAKEQEWYEQRSQDVVNKSREAINDIPEYKQLFTENLDILNTMPQHVEYAFLEAEDAPLAFMALAKEGKLESLQSMSPAKVAMEIGKAEIRGAAMSKVKTITNAPSPIKPIKGAGVNIKQPHQMSADEIVNWVNN